MKKIAFVIVLSFIAGAAVAAGTLRVIFNMAAPYQWTATAGDQILQNGNVIFTVPALPAGTSSMKGTVNVNVLAQ